MTQAEVNAVDKTVIEFPCDCPNAKQGIHKPKCRGVKNKRGYDHSKFSKLGNKK
jgi:hypothetical protein